MVLCDPAFPRACCWALPADQAIVFQTDHIFSKPNNIRLSVIWVEFEVPSPIR
jgi:hypothetical protein